MQKISLLIQPYLRNGGNSEKFEYLDLMEEDLITLTQVIQDVREIDKIFTDFSKTFNLPASKTNNRIFRNWYNQDVVGFDNQTFSNAKIQLNHSDFKTGKIKLENVVMKNNKPYLYKVTFFGNTVSLTDLMATDKLDALFWLNNFNTESDASNVKDGLVDGLDFTVDSVTYTDAIIFPLITHTQKYILDNTSQADNIGNISTSQTNNDKRGVLPEDLKPAIKVSLIIKAIEQRYGLNFKSGGFFDSSAITNMYMWLHRNKGKMITGGTWLGFASDSNLLEYDCSGSAENDCTFLTNPLEPSGFFAATGSGAGIYFYKSILRSIIISGGAFTYLEQGGSYTIKITPTSGTTSNVYSLKVYALVNGISYIIASALNVSGTKTITIDLQGGVFANPLLTVPVYPVVESENGVEFQSEITIFREYFYINNFFPTLILESSATATFTSTVSNLVTTGGLINITSQVPEISVIEFLKGLFKMHNLTAFVNNDNEIVVESLNDFYAGGQVLDLTKYINTDEHIIESTLPFSEVKLEYSDAKTILAQEFLNLNHRKFGSIDFYSGGNTTKKYKIKAPFEHMIFERLTFGSTQQSTSVMYGLHINESLEPSIGAPLLFYANNVTITDENSEINFVESIRPSDDSLPASGTRHSLNKFWMPSNTDTTTPTTAIKPNHELHFGSEINAYSLTDYSGTTNSLFNLYYLSYIQRVFNVKTRLYKYKAVLPLGILLKLSLDDKIIVGTNLYTINKMTTKLQSGETELELLSEAT